MLLFLGAGASASFGIPDTKGFLSDFEKEIGEDQIYKMLKANIQNDQFDAEVLMTILNDLSKTQEELMGSIAPHTATFLLKSGHHIQQLVGEEDNRKHCHQLLTIIKRIIRVKCLTQVKNERSTLINTYDSFFRQLKIEKPLGAGDGGGARYPSPLWIFTTNYDTCMETYFNAKQVNVARGIIDKHCEHIFDVDDLVGQSKSFELVKLHGSIDLFVKNRRIRFLSGAGAMDKQAMTHLGEDYGQEFMVYPVESSTSSEMSQSPLIELLNFFKKRLGESKTWIIIGSTFRDLTLASLMDRVIMQKREIEKPLIIHINPKATEINGYLASKGYEQLARSILPIDGHFLDDKVQNDLSGRVLKPN